MKTTIPTQAQLPEVDADGALPCDIALLAGLEVTPEQRRQLVHYAATRRPPTSVKEITLRWLGEAMRNAGGVRPEGAVTIFKLWLGLAVVLLVVTISVALYHSHP